MVGSKPLTTIGAPSPCVSTRDGRDYGGLEHDSLAQPYARA